MLIGEVAHRQKKYVNKLCLYLTEDGKFLHNKRRSGQAEPFKHVLCLCQQDKEVFLHKVVPQVDGSNCLIVDSNKVLNLFHLHILLTDFYLAEMREVQRVHELLFLHEPCIFIEEGDVEQECGYLGEFLQER